MNFVIAGAQKAGTTALTRFLSQHPEICMADDKEVHLFDDPEYSSDWTREAIDARYAQSFTRYSGEAHVGDATPIYLYWPHIPAELRRYNPDLRVIVLLRDPVERAISHHAMERGRDQEWLPLLPALLLESWRLRRDRGNTRLESSWRRHSYADRGFYSHQLATLFQAFPEEQVLILSSDALRTQHAATLERVFAFLGVTDRACVPPQENVFAGESRRGAQRMARALLERKFAGEELRLRRWLGTV